MRNLYCFVLGTNHSLCKIDALNILNRHRFLKEVVAASKETLIVSTQKKFDLKTVFPEFGGAVKVVEIIDSFPIGEFPRPFLEKLWRKEYSCSFSPQNPQNIDFGVSVYHSGGLIAEVNDFLGMGFSLSQEMKKALESQGIKARFINKKGERFLSSVSVKSNHLLDQGFELVFCVDKKQIYLGKTIIVQEFEEYGIRDYNRPQRDPKSGMVPLKLAKMMINLANKDKKAAILDPFCGAGTIIQELAVLGYTKLFASDLSDKAVGQTRENFSWLSKNFPKLAKEKINLKLFQADASLLSRYLLAKSIDAIITEPYLGPTNVRFFDQNRIKAEIEKLERLYLASFVEFGKILRKDGVVVILFPVFRHKREFFHLQILEKLKDFGFLKRNYLPANISTNILHLELTSRESIVYYRPGQGVSREVFVFEKN